MPLGSQLETVSEERNIFSSPDFSLCSLFQHFSRFPFCDIFIMSKKKDRYEVSHNNIEIHGLDIHLWKIIYVRICANHTATHICKEDFELSASAKLSIRNYYVIRFEENKAGALGLKNGTRFNRCSLKDQHRRSYEWD